MGNQAMQQSLRDAGINLGDEAYAEIKNALVAEGVIGKGRGRGGSIYRTTDQAPAGAGPDFELKPQSAPTELDFYAEKSGPAHNKTKSSSKTKPGKRSRQAGSDLHEVLSYRYDDKRPNTRMLAWSTPARTA